MPRIPRDSNAVRQITTLLRADPFGKALLTGHIGVGKSTELVHLTNELASERFTIRCSVAESVGAQNADTFTLLFVVLEAAISAWISQLGPMPPGLVEQLVDRVEKLVPEEWALGPQDRARAKISQYYSVFREVMREAYGKLTARIRTGEELETFYSDCIRRLAIRYVAGADLASIDVSAAAERCEVILKEIAERSAKPVLLVIDDLDKVMDPALQQSLFIDRATAWRRLPCAVVATLPFDAYFGERIAEIEQSWTEVLVLDPLPIPKSDRQSLSKEPALQPYRAMLHEAGAGRLFTARQEHRLAYASGGLPRTFISFCNTCALYALEANEGRVLDSHIELVLQDMANKWRGRLTDADYEGIRRVLQSEGANVRNAIQPLRDGVLVRDGSQCRIAPWAEPLLKAYEKRTRAGDADAAKNRS
jgi:hypothetical protein